MLRQLIPVVLLAAAITTPASAQTWTSIASVTIGASVPDSVRAHITAIATNRERVAVTAAIQVRYDDSDPRGGRIEAYNGSGQPLLMLYYQDGVDAPEITLESTAIGAVLDVIPTATLLAGYTLNDLSDRIRRHRAYRELLQRIVELAAKGRSYRTDADAQFWVQTIGAHVEMVKHIPLPVRDDG